MNEDDYVGRPVTVYNEDRDETNSGKIDDYYPGRGFHIQFYDGTEQWVRKLDEYVTFDDEEEQIDHEGSLMIVPPGGGGEGGSGRNSGKNSARGYGLGATGGTEVSTDELAVLDKLTNTYLHSGDVEKRNKNNGPAGSVMGSGTYGGGDTNGESLRIISKLGTQQIPHGQQSMGSPTTVSPRALSSMLPKEKKGVLLHGKVSSISNITLPAAASAAAGGGGGAVGGVFYRVFYQEGAGKSNIYNADIAQPVTFGGAGSGESCTTAVWSGSTSTFPFEMVLPPDVRAITDLTGEVVLSFFRVRAGGGNDVVGHLLFKLRDLAGRAAQNGSRPQSADASRRGPSKYGRREGGDPDEEAQDEGVESYGYGARGGGRKGSKASSIEVRTIEGSFILCSQRQPSGQYVPMSDGPEVKLRLDLCWRGEEFEAPALAPAASNHGNMDSGSVTGGGSRSRRPSSANSSARGGGRYNRSRSGSGSRSRSRSRSNSPTSSAGGSAGIASAYSMYSSGDRRTASNYSSSRYTAAGAAAAAGAVAEAQSKPPKQRSVSGGKTRPKSAAAAGAGSAIYTGGMNGKVNREKQMRIDRENQLMAQKLSKMGRKAAPAGGAGTASSNKKPQDGINAAPSHVVPLKDRFKECDVKEKEAQQKEVQTLMELYTRVKGDVKALEVGNLELRAQLTKHQLSLKQCEMTSQRIVRQGAVAGSGGAGAGAGGGNSARNSTSGSLRSSAEQSAKMASAHEVQRVMHKYGGGGGGGEKGSITQQQQKDSQAQQQSSLDAIAAWKDAETANIENYTDPELRDVALEHVAMQESRMVLIARIAAAKRFCNSHNAQFSEVSNTAALVKSRIFADQQQPGGGAAGGRGDADEDCRSVGSARSGATGRSARSGVGSASRRPQSGKKASTSGRSTLPSRGNSSSAAGGGLYDEDEADGGATVSVQNEYDNRIRRKIKELTGEIAILQATLDDTEDALGAGGGSVGGHDPDQDELEESTRRVDISGMRSTVNLKLDSDIAEAEVIRSLLQAKMRKFTETLEELTYTRDTLQEKLGEYQALATSAMSKAAKEGGSDYKSTREDGDEDENGSVDEDGQTASGKKLSARDLRDRILSLRGKIMQFQSARDQENLLRRTTELEVKMVHCSSAGSLNLGADAKSTGGGGGSGSKS